MRTSYFWKFDRRLNPLHQAEKGEDGEGVHTLFNVEKYRCYTMK